MITVNVYFVKTKEVRIDSLNPGDGFITIFDFNGMVIDANYNNFTITPRKEIDTPVSVVMTTDGGAVFGVRNGDEMVLPCNVSIDYCERIVQ